MKAVKMMSDKKGNNLRMVDRIFWKGESLKGNKICKKGEVQKREDA